MNRLELFLAAICLLSCPAASAAPGIEPYNVVWKSQSADSWGSMPIGNGDIGANVWVTPSGELEFYISKTDAFSENNQLLKIGRLALKTTPNLLDGELFVQELDLRRGLIRIEGRKSGHRIELDFWIDAFNPAIYIEGKASTPVSVEIENKMWRTARREIAGIERHAVYGLYSAPYPLYAEPDEWVEAGGDMAWQHRNRSSIYEWTLENQGLEELKGCTADPLLDRTFGALVVGTGYEKPSCDRLVSGRPDRRIEVEVIVHSSVARNDRSWLDEVLCLKNRIAKTRIEHRKRRHIDWWNDFWAGHYIIVESQDEADEAFRVTQSYLLQRYMNASAGRGAMPIKFNGSIFTVDVVRPLLNLPEGLNADFRLWGGPYWWQNTRLPYSTMLYSGDYEMMKPLFKMYMDALPLAKFRVAKHFGHAGAMMPETFTFWGAYAIDNYGWDRTDKELPDGVPENKYIRHYFQSNLEVVAMMLDYYRFSCDEAFLDNTLFPFASEVLAFYDEHYGRDGEGRLLLAPAQSLETYFEGVVNPTPDVAGLKWILEQLSQFDRTVLPTDLAERADRLRAQLPEIALTRRNGKVCLAAGYNLGERMNVEKPELYAVFPYRLYGVGKPDLDYARNAYDCREVKDHWGWQQDGIFAACLGLTDEAKRIVVANFSTKHPDSRFPTYWGPNYDWIPDQDHGSVTMRALQNMLIQSDDKVIRLLPAWPDAWSVRFKLHTPGRGWVEGTYTPEGGLRLSRAQVDKTWRIVMDK